MVTRSINFAVGEFYHVYNRGVDKRNIFQNDSDYQRFQELLFLSNSSEPINVRDIKISHDSVFDYQRSEKQVSIGAYCLMPNHFHLLISPHTDKGLSTFMNKLSTSYSMYFNKRHDRTGSLFEGRFKAQHADSDEYLRYLYAYIHLNPVKLIDSRWRENGSSNTKRLFEYAAAYKYSTLSDYLGVYREEGVVIDQAPFPEFFKTPESYQSELFEWLTYEE